MKTAIVWLVASVIAASPAQKPQTARKPAPAVLSRPSARFSLLLLQYRRADADAAIESLSKWTEGEVLSEAVPSPNDDAWTRAALVSMLTEAGMRKGTFGRFSDFSPKSILLTGWGLDKNFEVYSFRSYSIVKDLTRMAQRRHDDALLTLCSRWYVMATVFSMRNGRPSFSGLQAMADHDLGETAAVRLLIGSLIEPRVGPFMPTATMGARPGLFMGPDGLAYQKACASPCPRVTPTQEALYLLHHAIDADPALVEAHLRLGHVLHLINQNIEAKPHLERALRDAREQHLNYLVYMAGLFLGDVAEHDNRFTDAIAYFREAIAVDPTAHIANVALGDALLRAGDGSGWAEARRMFDDEDQHHPKKTDPWFYYRTAQFWRLASDLREMRQLVRGTP
jgi:tetratricopeptide (TPR) repeat protein